MLHTILWLTFGTLNEYKSCHFLVKLSNRSLLVSITEASELLLTSSIPYVKTDGSMVGMEDHGVHLNTEGSDILLLELACQMSLDEGGLSDTTVSNENELELSNNLSLSFHFYRE